MQEPYISGVIEFITWAVDTVIWLSVLSATTGLKAHPEKVNVDIAPARTSVGRGSRRGGRGREILRGFISMPIGSISAAIPLVHEPQGYLVIDRDMRRLYLIVVRFGNK